MILLDTNVVSAAMDRQPHLSVLSWLDHQRTETLYISTVTIAEIGYGLNALPAGKRRRELEARFQRFVATGFAHRILLFDEAAARAYGEIMGHRRRRGRPMSALDGQIAAIASANQIALATRNVRDFEQSGIEVINPFDFSE
ncbi:MAG TPA: type II toxin-antitoxin system VapC family toxin [Thermoanaerobaculia bacterium]|nr:type II toxin-antitoxin system VapC family toxin [Thermoanaerobaculia bacterium]